MFDIMNIHIQMRKQLTYNNCCVMYANVFNVTLTTETLIGRKCILEHMYVYVHVVLVLISKMTPTSVRSAFEKRVFIRSRALK